MPLRGALCRTSLAAGTAVVALLGAYVAWQGWPRTQAGPSVPRAALIDPGQPCGPVCLAVATGIVGRGVPLREATSMVNADALGRCTMADLIAALRAKGFGAEGVRIDQAALRRLAGIPLILYLNGSHFVVVLPIGDGSVVLFDPPREPTLADARSLAGTWSGEAIVVAADEAALGAARSALGLPPGPADAASEPGGFEGRRQYGSGFLTGVDLFAHRFAYPVRAGGGAVPAPTAARWAHGQLPGIVMG